MERLWAPWRMQYVSGGTEKIEGCVFCKAPEFNQDKKYHIIHRGKHNFVIMNKFPYNNGHVMVVPFMHTNDVLELPEDAWNELNRLVKTTIKAIRMVYNPHAINMGMNMGKAAGAGIEEHIHYHILPRWEGDTNFMPVIAQTKVISESMDAAWEKLKEAFNKLGE